jgi:hypothetical protein
MLKINLKKKSINTQNSHYFLYLCVLFSSKYLENYYLLNYLAKKTQKKKKVYKTLFYNNTIFIFKFFLF